MAFRGIRGATTVEANTREAILAATKELLAELIRQNDIRKEDVASAYFSTTVDLDAEFPAVAARNGFGWDNVALMCVHELAVPGSLPMCLRILLHVNTDLAQDEVNHVYLRGASVRAPTCRPLRPETSNSQAPPIPYSP
jgi:chorismate mutase